ncbi:MAG: glycosyltransferase family 4 protein [Patescibacteria group bacterium]|nr:glycosyltransferase family 4 protein [Patescibacteria group bacterium]
MRILMFGWEFPPHNSGGLGVACYGLSKALAQSGSKVTFVLPKRLKDTTSRFARIIFGDVETPDIVFHNIPSLLSPYTNPDSYKKERAFIDNAFYGDTLFEEVRRYAIRAREIARKEQFDVIHAHDWLSFLAGMEAKKVSGKPLIVHVHATEFDRTGGRSVNQFVYDVEREGMHAADRVIAVSNYTKDIIVKRYGVPEEKVEVVHNGIDIDEYLSQHVGEENRIAKLKESGNKIVLFVGRITIQKGPDYFVAAAKKVLEYYPKVTFIISGSGDMEGQIMNQAAFLGISDKVLFAGFLRNDELVQAYKAADLYLMPSVSEPFGITPLEAIASGTPVIISRQSGVSEVLKHALKVDFWDVDEMANKIVCVLTHESLKSCLSENGFQEIIKHTWKQAAEKCMMIYKKVFGLSIYNA